MTDTIILLFTGSIFFLTILLVVPELFDDRDLLRHIWVNAAFALLGAGTFLLGVSFFQRSWPMAALFGTLFSVYGAQITLWVVGIRLDFLGNVPTTPDAPVDPKIELADEGNAFYISLYHGLNKLITTIYYMDRHNHSENAGEIREAIKHETDNILEVFIDKPATANAWHIYSLFVDASLSLRFGSFSEVLDKLPLLEDLRGLVFQHTEAPFVAYRTRARNSQNYPPSPYY